LDFLSADRYQLLIAGLQMPGNMQFELIERLEHLAPAMPVILVTGYPSLNSAIRAVELPVIAYLIKPFDFDDLLRFLRKAIPNPSADQLRQRRP
jgi:DNA-binding NtrC family response regulator